MSKKPKPKLDDKAQSRRFVETARDLESDESGQAFEKALKIVVPIKKSARKTTAR